ncbi:MAG: alpha/beta hydrolase, partial [Pseudomonadota bacterium]
AMTGPDGASRETGWLSRFLKLGLVGEPLFRLLTRPGTIRYFLKRTWGSPHFDRGLADYDALITRQSGAHYAPLAFISGRLFSRDIRRVYENLEQEILLGHGTRGDFKDFRGAAWTEARANWTTVAFQTGALPHFERPDTFFGALDKFLGV